ncbi:Zinc finger CCCH domain-containing protein 7 [Acorus gramineus]|uniref:Zinc finger CCCH domain-containing protein 7 n=1 Tax=Acorus gramineus TaxID=55184 RepID=A0AAV9AN54_ACOGR|nr:Zinc finger CCCH domain-containing protein 7 [Acorus gramineus]
MREGLLSHPPLSSGGGCRRHLESATFRSLVRLFSLFTHESQVAGGLTREEAVTSHDRAGGPAADAVVRNSNPEPKPYHEDSGQVSSGDVGGGSSECSEPATVQRFDDVLGPEGAHPDELGLDMLNELENVMASLVEADENGRVVDGEIPGQIDSNGFEGFGDLCIEDMVRGNGEEGFVTREQEPQRDLNDRVRVEAVDIEHGIRSDPERDVSDEEVEDGEIPDDFGVYGHSVEEEGESEEDKGGEFTPVVAQVLRTYSGSDTMVEPQMEKTNHEESKSEVRSSLVASSDSHLSEDLKKASTGKLDYFASLMGYYFLFPLHVDLGQLKLLSLHMNPVHSCRFTCGYGCKDDKVREKKKRGPLTEERREKKKIAKKRKRAQKNREQGVKRLKIQPIIKPKTVKHCSFFLKGRCQQPCKHFACGMCLKGDDCPFDHELSKYPCHKIMSTGICPRGNSCKFSHKISVAEGSAAPSLLSKLDPPVTLDKLTTNSQPDSKHSSSVAKDSPRNLIPAKAVERTFELPTRIPKGISFLSFGGSPAGNTNKQQQQQQKLPPNLHDSKGKSVLSLQAVPSSTQTSKMAMIAGHESKLKSAQKPMFLPPPDMKNSEVPRKGPSDAAAKILEEFLFGGGDAFS